MELQERLRSDLNSALKSGYKERADFLRFILAQLHNREIEKRSHSSEPVLGLTDEEVIGVLQKEAKKRKEAAEMFKKGGRQDLAEREERELALINEYLPAQMSHQEVEEEISRLLAGGLSDFNSLMREAIKNLKNRADGRVVSDIIKKRLAGREQ